MKSICYPSFPWNIMKIVSLYGNLSMLSYSCFARIYQWLGINSFLSNNWSITVIWCLILITTNLFKTSFKMCFETMHKINTSISFLIKIWIVGYESCIRNHEIRKSWNGKKGTISSYRHLKIEPHVVHFDWKDL